MFQYVRNQMGIKEKTDLENAKNDVKQLDEIAGGALVDLGDLAAGNMDAIAELGEIIAGLEARVAALEESASQ